jgi:hypothetical protein
MRKVTICFLLMLCSVLAFGQQRWAIVGSVALFNQSQGILRTTIFTPTELGIYRLNFYFSVLGGNEKEYGNFYEDVYITDISGQEWDPSPYGACSGGYYRPVDPITISLKPNVPVEFATHYEGVPRNSPCVYNLAITVEELVQ